MSGNFMPILMKEIKADSVGKKKKKKSESTLDSIIVFIRLLSRSFFSIIGFFFFI